MMRSTFVAVILSCSCASMSAADYLLRLDTIGYADQITGDGVPQAKILRSVEVLVHPHMAFRAKASSGPDTLTLSGTLQPVENGAFRLQLRYVHVSDTGETIPTPGGARGPLLDTSSAHTKIAVDLDNPVTIAAAKTTAKQPGKPERKSETRFVATLTRYKAAGD